MFKKILLLSGLFGLLFFGIAGECFADVSAELGRAEIYKEAGYYERAEEIYKTIAADYPGTDYGLEAQTNLIMLYLETDNDADALSALATLGADFSEHPRLPEVLLYNIAGECTTMDKYEEAEGIFQQVIQQYPGTPYASKAQMAIPLIDVLSLIDSGQDAAARSATDKLIADFNDRPDLPEALYHIVGRYEDTKKYEEGESICKHIIQNYPGTDYALRAEKKLVIWYVSQGRNDEAQAATDRLIIDSNGHPDSEALYAIAGTYEQVGKHEEANSIYQQIILLYPGSTYAGKAQLDISRLNVLSLMGLGRDTEVQVALDGLIADFNDHPDLPPAVFVIGEQYYNKALQMQSQGRDEQAKDYFTKAITVWERIIQQLPASAAHTPRAYCSAARCCFEHLGEYEKAIEYCQKVVADWPDNKYAWYAQFSIGNYFERLRDSGILPESEANPLIEQAYKAVVEKYPDCYKAKYAAFRLAESAFEKENWTDVVNYNNFLLTKFESGEEPVVVLYPLALGYDNLDLLKEALENYKLFTIRANTTDPRRDSALQRITELEAIINDQISMIPLSDTVLAKIYGGCEICALASGTCQYNGVFACGSEGCQGTPPTWCRNMMCTCSVNASACSSIVELGPCTDRAQPCYFSYCYSYDCICKDNVCAGSGFTGLQVCGGTYPRCD